MYAKFSKKTNISNLVKMNQCTRSVVRTLSNNSFFKKACTLMKLDFGSLIPNNFQLCLEIDVMTATEKLFYHKEK